MKKITVVSAIIILFYSCKHEYYTVPVKDFAKQLSKLNIVKEKKLETNLNIKVMTVRHIDEYVNDLQYLNVYDSKGKSDSIYVRGSLFNIYFRKSNTGYQTMTYCIVRNNFLLVIEDSILTIRPKCKYCKISIDSITKVVIRK